MERKILIKLKKGSYLDLACKNQYIMSDKPYVAIASNGVQALVSQGKADFLANLKEDATQEAFNKALFTNNGDEVKAVAEFLETYDANKVQKEPTPSSSQVHTQTSGKAKNQKKLED